MPRCTGTGGREQQGASMKLRIRGNSIRIRLGQSEVRMLATDGVVEEVTVFGPSRRQHFGYALFASPAELSVGAAVDDGRIVISAPADLIQRWATTDQIGINAVQRTGDDGDLTILIEKDFECIDAPPEESQEDAFPRRQQSGAACKS